MKHEISHLIGTFRALNVISEWHSECLFSLYALKCYFYEAVSVPRVQADSKTHVRHGCFLDLQILLNLLLPEEYGEP